MKTEPAKIATICADPACREHIHIGDPVCVLELVTSGGSGYYQMHRDCARSFGEDLARL